MIWSFIIGSAIFFFFEAGSAATEAPVVGRKAAEKYFRTPAQNRGDFQDLDASEPVTRRPANQVLALYLGSFISSDVYAWGPNGNNRGRANYGVSYLFDEWRGFDRNLQVEFQEFQFPERRPRKLNFTTLITFPRAESEFPLYFGAGLGFGVFFEQLSGESELSFDYRLCAGVRFYDVFGSVGVFAEIAMKNHLHLLSDGQLNGTTLVTGAVFRF
jgi:hypothetical protein